MKVSDCDIDIVVPGWSAVALWRAWAATAASRATTVGRPLRVCSNRRRGKEIGSAIWNLAWDLWMIDTGAQISAITKAISTSFRTWRCVSFSRRCISFLASG
jgi:hypothetical protein